MSDSLRSAVLVRLKLPQSARLRVGQPVKVRVTAFPDREFDGAINYWNKAAEETYGFTAEQACGRKVHELLLAVPPTGRPV